MHFSSYLKMNKKKCEDDSGFQEMSDDSVGSCKSLHVPVMELQTGNFTKMEKSVSTTPISFEGAIDFRSDVANIAEENEDCIDNDLSLHQWQSSWRSRMAIRHPIRANKEPRLDGWENHNSFNSCYSTALVPYSEGSHTQQQGKEADAKNLISTQRKARSPISKSYGNTASSYSPQTRLASRTLDTAEQDVAAGTEASSPAETQHILALYNKQGQLYESLIKTQDELIKSQRINVNLAIQLADRNAKDNERLTHKNEELIRRSRDVVGQEGVVPENLHPPNGGQGEAVREVVNNENPGLVANDPAAAGVVPPIRWINEERLAELAIGSDPSKFIRSLMRELFTEQDLARITFSEMEQGHQTLIFNETMRRFPIVRRRNRTQALNADYVQGVMTALFSYSRKKLRRQQVNNQ